MTKVLTSAASAGGSATESLTVTGLATTDTILAVSQSTAGAGSGKTLIAYGSPAANALSCTWSADPGAGAVVKVAFLRAASGYQQATQSSRPNYTLPAGAGLAEYTVYIDYLLKPNILPVVSNYGIGGN